MTLIGNDWLPGSQRQGKSQEFEEINFEVSEIQDWIHLSLEFAEEARVRL